MGNLVQALVESARVHGDQPAIRQGDVILSYAQLDDASSRVAAMLRTYGVRPGDRVGVMLPNVVSFPVDYCDVLRAGGVVVPINPLLKSREVAFYLDDSEAKAIFAYAGVAEEALKGAADAGAEAKLVTPGEFETSLAELAPESGVAPRADSDTAVILYTSGTTGKPKGAELTQANMARNAEVSSRLFSLGPGDVIFGGLPLFHSFGQTCGLNAAIHSGASLSLLPRFDPAAALETIQRDRVTVMEGVPTMNIALLNHPERASYDTSALRLCVSGGAALPVEVLRGFEAAFGSSILEGYGLSETSPVASFNHPDRERKAGSIGTPIEGVEFRLVDDQWDDMGERGRGDRDSGAQRHEGLLATTGSHRGSAAGRLVPHRRHGPPR